MPKPTSSDKARHSYTTVRVNPRQSSGMAEDLRLSNQVQATTWGTDLDVRQFFGGKFASHGEPYELKNHSIPTYIFSPVSLTEEINDENIFDKALSNAIQKVKTIHPEGHAAIRFLVNDSNKHWLVAELEMNDGKLSAAKLWNSLPSGPTPDIDVETATQVAAIDAAIARAEGGSVPVAKMDIDDIFDAAIKKQDATVDSIYEFGNVQRNGHSCMDYCLQRLGIPELAGITDPTALRFAIVKQIAENHPTLHEFANLLAKDDKGNVGFYEAATAQAVTSKAQLTEVSAEEEEYINRGLESLVKKDELTNSEKDALLKFDAAIAKNLDTLYRKNSTQPESELFAIARHDAMRKSDVIKELRGVVEQLRILGFFAPDAKQAAASPALDAKQTHDPSPRKS